MAGAGVAAGVAFLFAILSLNAQLASEVRDSASVLAGPRLLQVTPTSPGGLPEGVAAELATDDRVEAAAPLLVARATASNGSDEVGLFVVGSTPAVAPLVPGSVASLGSVEIPSGGALVVSRTLADRLHADPGDQLAVHASTGITRLPVAAVVSSPLISRVNGGLAAAMPLADAQRIFDRPGRVDQILVLAKEGTDLSDLRHDIATTIKGTGVVGAPGEATGGGSTDFAAVQGLTNMMAVFVLFVAVILVFHTMSMASAERRTEIALARSLGSSKRQLMAGTLIEAALVGVAGAAVGLLAGAGLARLVVPLARYAYGGTAPVDIPADVILHAGAAAIAALAGVVGAVLGAVIPARAAARAQPIDAFRPSANYEWRDPGQPARKLALAAGGAVLLVVGAVIALRDTTGDPSDPRTMLPTVAVFAGALILVPLTVPFISRGAAALLSQMSSTTGRFAGDALRANPRRTTVTVIALLLPVATVIATVVSFDAGFVKLGQIARAVVSAPLNVDAESYVGGPGGSVAAQPLAPAHQRLLEGVEGVRAVLPYENANVRLPDDTSGVVYAIPLAAADRAGVADLVRFPSLANDPAAFTASLLDGGIAASRFAARSLDLQPGSKVTLPTATGEHTFTVGAVFDDWAFQGTFAIDIDTYRSIWGDQGAFRFAIAPDVGADIAEVHQRIDAAVDAGSMPARVETRAHAVTQLKDATASLLPLMRAISLASLIFSVLALANAAFTAVTERRWSFALQRTLGMTNRQITRSLGLEALAIGLIGAVGAAIVGLGVSVFTVRILGNQLATTLPHPIPWSVVGGCTVLGIVIAASATAYPRRTARRLTIIEALRVD